MRNGRGWYTLKYALKYRDSLARYLKVPALQAETLERLCPQQLLKSGIKALALDFDGVLAPHGAAEVEGAPLNWLVACLDVYTPAQIYILSNKPNAVRAAFFARHFPGIRFVTSVRKKPYPDGLAFILKEAQIRPEALLMIDDRLLTGILAATLADVQACWITKPLADFKARPLAESFYWVLRRIERWFLRR